MGLQLIFCVETNSNCKSDQIYIKKTIERFYSISGGGIKLSWVFMDGRGNYSKPKIGKKLTKLRRDYKVTSPNNESKVIMCFDCDDYDRKHEDKEFLSDAKKYCQDNGYEFVWFCREIESVYLGRIVPDNLKHKEALNFTKMNLIRNVELKNLKESKYQDKRSNLCCVLDSYLSLS